MGSQGSKGHFHQNATFLQITWYGHVILAYASARYPLRNSWIKKHSGSFGVTGVKRSFSPKMLLLLQITHHGHVTHAYASARYLLKKYGPKKLNGVIWGHRGPFSSKML